MRFVKKATPGICLSGTTGRLTGRATRVCNAKPKKFGLRLYRHYRVPPEEERRPAVKIFRVADGYVEITNRGSVSNNAQLESRPA
jgi:hypothetical protein